MDGIFFLLLAFCTIYMSIKLSYYGDVLSKQSKVGAAFVGGLLIASITSLPEFVTSVSAVVLDNASLSFGDIVGSNMFNIFVLAVYNIYFFKSNLFRNTSNKYIFECLILVSDYIFIILGCHNIIVNIVSLLLFFAYLVYMYSVFKNDKKEEEEINEKQKFILLKFILTGIVMVVLSVLLTYQADKIAHMYPKFSSSSIGAILLGITTSLPEVVTTFALLKLNNYNMAISNMLGSNIFNFLVLAISDLFIKDNYIYSYADKYSMFYIFGGIFIIILFAISISPKTLQNDTFYTIKIGELIVKNKNIDMLEHFSWHSNLKYTYPHWLYDVIIYLIYNIGGMVGIYISTCIFAAILGIVFFSVNVKINKNQILSFFMTILGLYMLKSFIAARAQLVTYILFILQIYSMEKLLETGKKRYGIYLIIDSLLVANLHVAVWPFSFVLYLPYMAEYFIACLKKKENNSKIIINKNPNTKILIVFMICCILTGIFTPLGDTPYTYLIKTMKGTTTNFILEHQPMILINNIDVICVLIVLFGLLMFTDAKIEMSDLFMICGLIILMLYSGRQKSIFIIIGLICINRIISEFCNSHNSSIDKQLVEAIMRKSVIAIIIICFIIVDFCLIFEKRNDQYVDEKTYPVEMSNYILDYFKETGFYNVRIFNEYNYGSYLLYRGIPVFIDSRADLYSPEFNSGVNVFEDSESVGSFEMDIDEFVEKYNITHIILSNQSQLNKVLKKIEGTKYKLVKEDENFSFYKIENL